jgi:KGK domain
MQQKFQYLDITSQHKDTVLSLNPSVFRLSDLFTIIRQILVTKGFAEISQVLKEQSKGGIHPQRSNNLFDQGMDCELLSSNGKGWQKGKVRVTVCFEFYPEEVESPDVEVVGIKPSSPLDDVRQMISQDS